MAYGCVCAGKRDALDELLPGLDGNPATARKVQERGR